MKYSTLNISVYDVSYISMTVCQDCGCIVGKKRIHDKWHEEHNGARISATSAERAAKIEHW